MVRSTETTHEVRLATSGRPWASTIRPRWGCTTISRTDCDGGLGVVLLAADDLQVVEPHEQGREEREDERLDHDQPQPAPALPLAAAAGDGSRQAARSGSSRRNIPITSGSTNGVSSDVPDHRDQRSPGAGRATPSGRVAQHQPAEREDRGADERRGGDRGDDGGRGRARRPGGPGRRRSPTTTRASAQRPATWSAGGARSSTTPATKPSTAANCGPRVSAAPTTTSRQRLGTMPCQARCGKQRDLEDQGQRDGERRRRRTRSELIAGSRRPRSRPGRCGCPRAPRRRPGRARRSRRTGSITARCEVSRRLV